MYGLQEDGVGLDLEQLKKMAPQDVLDKVAGMREKIINGEIKIPTTGRVRIVYTITFVHYIDQMFMNRLSGS